MPDTVLTNPVVTLCVGLLIVSLQSITLREGTGFLLCPSFWYTLGVKYMIVDSKFGAQWPEQTELLVL